MGTVNTGVFEKGLRNVFGEAGNSELFYPGLYLYVFGRLPEF